MLDELEVAIHFQQMSMHYNVPYQMIRVQYKSESSVTMTLTDGETVHPIVEQAEWFEFTALIHFSDFTVLKWHMVCVVFFISPKSKIRWGTLWKTVTNDFTHYHCNSDSRPVSITILLFNLQYSNLLFSGNIWQVFFRS